MGSLVSYELSDNIATITMDDGKVNALSPHMLAELGEAFDRAESDGAVVVLAGRGGVFSAGFDLKVLTGGGAAGPDLLKSGFVLSARMLAFPAPIVIAVSGHALAMGLFLVLSGDYRVGVVGEFKIGANEVAIGMTMPETAIEICRQRVGPQFLSRVIDTAEIFRPEEAVLAGLLDRVVEPEELAATARAAATRLGALNRAAHAATKLRLRASVLANMRLAIEADDAAFRAVS